MYQNIINAIIEIGQLEAVLWVRNITLATPDQREYTSRRILAFLAGCEAPTE